MKNITTSEAVPVPSNVAVCPICGAALEVQEITEWEADTGRPLSASFNCATEPDIDGPHWWGWHLDHWSTPYVDWLPLERPVLAWLAEGYRVDDSQR